MSEEDQTEIDRRIGEYLDLTNQVSLTDRNRIAKSAVTEYLGELKATRNDFLRQVQNERTTDAQVRGIPNPSQFEGREVTLSAPAQKVLESSRAKLPEASQNNANEITIGSYGVMPSKNNQLLTLKKAGNEYALFQGKDEAIDSDTGEPITYKSVDEAVAGVKAEMTRKSRRFLSTRQKVFIDAEFKGQSNEGKIGQPRAAKSASAGAVASTALPMDAGKLKSSNFNRKTAYEGATPEQIENVAGLGSEIGWAETGGRLIRDAEGNASARTNWVANSPFWPGRPDAISAKDAKQAFRLLKAGEPMSAQQKRFVDYSQEYLQRDAEINAKAEIDYQKELDSQALEGVQGAENLDADSLTAALDIADQIGNSDLNGSSVSNDEFLRALGATEEEINDAKKEDESARARQKSSARAENGSAADRAGSGKEQGGTVEVAITENETRQVSESRTPANAGVSVSERRTGSAGMSKAATQKMVDEVTKGWKVKVNVLAREDAAFETSADAQGVWRDGQIYLFHDNIPNQYVGEFTLLHEAFGHMGLRGVLGNRLNAAMNQIYRGNDWIARAADTWAKDEGNAWKRGDMSAAEWTALSTEEAMADVAASQSLRSRFPDLNGWDKLLVAVRNALRNLGFVSKMTDKDIASLLTDARNLVTQGGIENSSDNQSSTESKDQTKSKAFKNWFDNSKVVDDKGDPLVVYHGTSEDFNGFAGSSYHPGSPALFTSSPKLAEYYAADANYNRATDSVSANVIPVYLSLKNPLVVDAKGKQLANSFGSLGYLNDVYQKAVQGRHDGVIFENAKDDPSMRFGKVDNEKNLTFSEVKRSAGPSTIYAVFNKANIKSAIGNNGNFNTSENITESRAISGFSRDELGKLSTNAKNIPRLLKNAGIDKRGLGLQFLGRRQLTEIYNKILPQMKPYNDTMQKMDAEKNEMAADADALVKRWEKLKDADKLADLMHDSTLNQIDPSKGLPAAPVEGQNINAYPALRDRWIRLTPEAKKVFLDARDSYRSHWMDVQKAIGQRIERFAADGNEKKAMQEKLQKQMMGWTHGIYFPLSRFGDYVTVVKDQAGVTQAVSMSESMTQAENDRATLVKEFPTSKGFVVGKVQRKKEYNAKQDGVSKQFVGKLFEVIDRNGGDAKETAILKDAVNQLYLTSLPDLSWAKHSVHRKGTPGYNRDARRAYASNMFHGGFYLARLRHADVLQDRVREMQEHVDENQEKVGYDGVKAQQVVDEMVKRHDATMNPISSPISNFLTSMGFIWHMGLSPASAIVNLTQTVLVAAPIIGARFGFDKTAAALVRASKEALTAKNDMGTILKGEEKTAFDQAVKEGIIDLTMAHDLAGISEGRDTQLNGIMSPLMRAASFMFHHAEKFNRQTTFVAAFRLARESGQQFDQAYDTARDMTYKGHFDLSSSNRPRAMMGPVARVVLLFKQFGQNMIYTLTRNAYLAAKGDREALRVVSSMLAMHGLAAGAFGLPLVGTILGAASALGSTDDDPWDAKVALRNYLADAVGQDVAEALVRGAPRLLPKSIFPSDISGRIGLDQILFRDGNPALQGSAWYNDMATNLLGPVAGIGMNIVRGSTDVMKGDYLRGIGGMMPVSIANPIKALRYSQDGVKDATGVEIVQDTTVQEEISQLLGFSPARVKEAFEGKAAIINAKRSVDERRQELLRDFSRAVIKGDNDARADAIQKIGNFNKSQPLFAITSSSLSQSVKKRIERENTQTALLPKKERSLLDRGRFANISE